ncbi:DUF2526 family protein [Enterobacter sp. Ap-1006]|uniref:DUF2526 family protein n=1 Tax=Enterobacter sp. Ap-1006 TaxID=2608345 RepID=UPI0014248C4E|nr:DUF2526 family protein [Enterobacter sp. Ap-1006]NIF47454.1 DUF2526 family protein [Enterobacter sp. Ap-1006]
MTHLADVISRVDDAIAKDIIIPMNELLIELSDDAALTREDRYAQQQRLRIAIAHKGNHHTEDAEERREQLTRGGTIL